MKKEKKLVLIFLSLYIVAAVGILWAAVSTEAVISLATGLKIGGAATDRIGFYDATPTPKPIVVGTPSAANIGAALAALGLFATATPTPTSTPTPTP